MGWSMKKTLACSFHACSKRSVVFGLVTLHGPESGILASFHMSTSVHRTDRVP